VIVDAHAHVFSDAVLQRRAAFAERDRWFGLLNPPGSRRLASPGRLVAAMDAAGVDAAWVLSFGWADNGLCVEQNECVLAAAERFPGRLIPFCTVQPRAGSAALTELERVARRGCRGVGELFPDGQDFSIDDVALMAPLLEACAALDLVVLVHASEPLGRAYAGKGETTPDRLIRLAALAREVAPSLRLVFAHLGGGLPFYELMPDVHDIAARVCYDTAAAGYLYSPAAIAHAAAIAPDRVLFGSDYPVIGLQRMVDFVRAAGLNPAQQDAVFAANALRVLGPRSTAP
jgi:predicted TIM-barrel fold metal-dependent hydrolase